MINIAKFPFKLFLKFSFLYIVKFLQKKKNHHRVGVKKDLSFLLFLLEGDEPTRPHFICNHSLKK